MIAFRVHVLDFRFWFWFWFWFFQRCAAIFFDLRAIPCLLRKARLSRLQGESGFCSLGLRGIDSV